MWERGRGGNDTKRSKITKFEKKQNEFLKMNFRRNITKLKNRIQIWGLTRGIKKRPVLTSTSPNLSPNKKKKQKKTYNYLSFFKLFIITHHKNLSQSPFSSTKLLRNSFLDQISRQFLKHFNSEIINRDGELYLNWVVEESGF